MSGWDGDKFLDAFFSPKTERFMSWLFFVVAIVFLLDVIGAWP